METEALVENMAVAKTEHLTTAQQTRNTRLLIPGSWSLFASQCVGKTAAEKGDSLPGPEDGLLFHTRRWIIGGDTHRDKEKTLLAMGARVETSRVREPGGLLCHVAVSAFMATGVLSGLSLAGHLAWPVFSLTPGPCWWCAHLSAKMNFGSKDSGKLAGHIVGWCLLPPFGPSWVFPFHFQWWHHVPYWGLLLWDSSSGYHHAWPRQTDSVRGSLTIPTLFDSLAPRTASVLQPDATFTARTHIAVRYICPHQLHRASLLGTQNLEADFQTQGPKCSGQASLLEEIFLYSNSVVLQLQCTFRITVSGRRVLKNKDARNSDSVGSGYNLKDPQTARQDAWPRSVFVFQAFTG